MPRVPMNTVRYTVARGCGPTPENVNYAGTCDFTSLHIFSGARARARNTCTCEARDANTSPDGAAKNL